MARPKKVGLDYFPKDVNFYDDPKIIMLLNKHGTLGVVVYDVLLSMVYRQGYYLEMPPEVLTLQVCRVIGNRWAKEQIVSQVIQSCAELGLIDAASLSQGVITSIGIQSRYSEVKSRSQFDKSRFWLLPETQQPSESAPENGVFAAETRVIATKTPVIAAETATKEKKRKEKKSYISAQARDYWEHKYDGMEDNNDF